MGVAIPTMSDYYLEDGQYKLKSKFSKWFRIGLMTGFTIGSMLSFTSTASDQHVGSHVWKKTKYTEFVQQANPNVSIREATGIVDAIFKWSDYFSLDPKLLLSIAKVESGFNKYAISSAGAMGLMQVMVKVHTDKIVMAKKVVGTPEPFDIEANIFMGAKIFKDCKDKFADKAPACYNGNISNTVYHDKVMGEYNKLQRI